MLYRGTRGIRTHFVILSLRAPTGKETERTDDLKDDLFRGIFFFNPPQQLRFSTITSPCMVFILSFDQVSVFFSASSSFFPFEPQITNNFFRERIYCMDVVLIWCLVLFEFGYELMNIRALYLYMLNYWCQFTSLKN